MTEWRNVRLPDELCALAERRYGSKFGSLEEFLTFLLKEAVADPTAALDENEQKMVEQRLRDLGYV